MAKKTAQYYWAVFVAVAWMPLSGEGISRTIYDNIRIVLEPTFKHRVYAMFEYLDFVIATFVIMRHGGIVFVPICHRVAFTPDA